MERGLRFIEFNIVFFILLCSITSCSGGEKQVLKDSLRYETKLIVDKLDSISTDETIDLNSGSPKFIVFLSLIKTANQNELLYLIKKHENPVVKGYAYIGIVVADGETKEADVEMKKHFKKVAILVSDQAGICNSSDVFIKNISKKKYRLQNVIQNKQKDSIDDTERKVIIEENKIRREQGMPEIVVPK